MPSEGRSLSRIAGSALDAVAGGMAVWVLLAGAAAMTWPEPMKAAIPTSCVPWLLGSVMFGMGLSLRGRDFALVLRRPRDVAVGVAAQYVCMPLAAWAIAKGLGLPDEIALGVVLVGACPGGTASNVIAYLAKGDVALSVTMTTCSTLLAPLATPAIVLLLAGRTVDVDALAMFLSIVKIVIAPVVAGVAANELLPRFAARIRRAPTRPASRRLRRSSRSRSRRLSSYPWSRSTGTRANRERRP